MRSVSLERVAEATGGTLAGNVERLAVARVGTDTRDIVGGELFFALAGPSFDGHAFLEDARDAGAKAAVVSSRNSLARRFRESDPGFPLVRAAVAGGLRVESIPGPSAAIAALQVSGLPTDAFTFVGFLPVKAGARRRRLEELHERRETVVAFESPHRIDASLADLEAIWGERPVALARELTKTFEEVLRGTAREVRAALTPERRRGEMVLVLGGRVRGEGGPQP